MRRLMIAATLLFLAVSLWLGYAYTEIGRGLHALERLNEEDIEATDPEESDWWLLAWKDEDGNMPASNPLPEVMAQRDDFLADQLDSEGLGDHGAARLRWVQRGPQNVGGRTRALVIHPGDPNIMWAGAASGGVWKSTDGGTSWFAINSPIGNLGIRSMAIHPANPDILYAGTGETYRGGGLFRSTDGGLSWNGIVSTAGWAHINHISVAVVGGNTHLLVATDGEVNRRGILRSTNDGLNWTQEVAGAVNAQFVAFDPTDSSRAVGEVMYDCVLDVYDCHKAVFLEEGTWTTAGRDSVTANFINPSGGRIEFAYTADEPSAVYALYATPGGTNGSSTLAKSVDRGESYEVVNTIAPLSASDYNNTLWVSPVDADLVIVGGGSFKRSTDGGATFTLLMEHGFASEHGHIDQHCAVSPPNYTENFERLYVCNDGGIFVTDDVRTATVYAEERCRACLFATVF